jgi:hypothetical protein
MIITLNLYIQALFTSFCIGYKPANFLIPVGVVLLALSTFMWGDLCYDDGSF